MVRNSRCFPYDVDLANLAYVVHWEEETDDDEAEQENLFPAEVLLGADDGPPHYEEESVLVR